MMFLQTCLNACIDSSLMKLIALDCEGVATNQTVSQYTKAILGVHIFTLCVLSLELESLEHTMYCGNSINK